MRTTLVDGRCDRNLSRRLLLSDRSDFQEVLEAAESAAFPVYKRASWAWLIAAINRSNARDRARLPMPATAAARRPYQRLSARVLDRALAIRAGCRPALKIGESRRRGRFQQGAAAQPSRKGRVRRYRCSEASSSQHQASQHQESQHQARWVLPESSMPESLSMAPVRGWLSCWRSRPPCYRRRWQSRCTG